MMTHSAKSEGNKRVRDEGLDNYGSIVNMNEGQLIKIGNMGKVLEIWMEWQIFMGTEAWYSK